MYNFLVAFYVLVLACVLSGAGYAGEQHNPALLIVALLCGGGALALARSLRSTLKTLAISLERGMGSWNLLALCVSGAALVVACLVLATLAAQGMLLSNEHAVEIALYVGAGAMLVAIVIPLTCGLIHDLRTGSAD